MCDCEQESKQAQAFGGRLRDFVEPLLVELDQQLDRRLVRTFLMSLQAIVTLRHTGYGLLLSELGGYILGPAQAPAGTKRLSNLLRSKKWGHESISHFLWRQANSRLEELAEQEQLALAVWDESVVEKPESHALEGLCAVRSSQAARLKRIKPGFYNPPGGRPIFVPGMQWLSVMVLGMSGPPTLAAMQWWTTRGQLASSRKAELKHMLKQCAHQWGKRVLHVWDRGFASRTWVEAAIVHDLRFLLRWKKGQKLVDAQGSRKAWQITRGKRSLGYRLIWDARRRCQRKTGIYFTQVTHPDFPDTDLWLLVSRPGQSRSPWYLLTNEPIPDLDTAWRLVLAYARRWQVEMAYRFSKTELAMQSPRLWFWHNRLKLMLMVSLVYAFLLSLLTDDLQPALSDLLRQWCHRTGKRHRDVSLPLYRIRSALSRLWLRHPPILDLYSLTPG